MITDATFSETPSTRASGACASATPLRLDFWDASRRGEALGLWRQMDAALKNRSLAASFTWTDAWLNHYGRLVPHQFVIAWRGDEPVGLCLVTESTGPLGVRTRHVGTAGERDEDSVCIEQNAVLASAADRGEFVTALQLQVSRQSSVDAVAWEGFAPEELPRGATTSNAWSVVVKPTFYFDLRRAREEGVDPVALLGLGTQQSIRRKFRDAGRVEVEWSETAAQAEAILAELISLHQTRWQAAGKPGSFASSVFCAFHREALERLLTEGRAAAVRVQSGGRTIGCTLLYIDENRALVYQGGWTLDGVWKSPGLIRDVCCLRECLRRGYDAYDFMAGESAHKRRLTTDQGRLVWATWKSASWKNRAVDRLRSMRRVWRTLWKRPSPAIQGRPSDRSLDVAGERPS
jgi:hypothetical protein